MSDFPRDEYRTALSASHFRSLKNGGYADARFAPPFVVKKEKDACLYDIDGNKYVDFDLRDGSVIAGHAHRTLTQFIKNGISSGLSSGLLNKFTHRLVRLFREIADFKNIAFFGGGAQAYLSVIRSARPAKISVTSSYLLEKLSPFGAVMAEKGKPCGLLFYEPVDFDDKLEALDPGEYEADKKCAVESRTAFRLKSGFMTDPAKTDYVLSADNIANGMDSAVVLSQSETAGELLPVYKSVAVLETMKYFRRRPELASMDHKKVNAALNGPVIWKGSIFKFRHGPETALLLKHGIYLKGNTGFLCAEHTGQDWNRLMEAVEKTHR